MTTMINMLPFVVFAILAGSGSLLRASRLRAGAKHWPRGLWRKCAEAIGWTGLLLMVVFFGLSAIADGGDIQTMKALALSGVFAALGGGLGWILGIPRVSHPFGGLLSLALTQREEDHYRRLRD